jgi:hypothetical protein
VELSSPEPAPPSPSTRATKRSKTTSGAALDTVASEERADSDQAATGEVSLPPLGFFVPTEAELLAARRTGVDSASSKNSVSDSANPEPKKRTRRAHSPARWIPASLQGLMLDAPAGVAPMPLPPVTPYIVRVQPSASGAEDVQQYNGLPTTKFKDGKEYVWEERNSFDQNVHPTPYHP